MDFSRPRVMGIINVNDNSFFPGSRYMQDDDIVRAAAMMLADGADILDIGGGFTPPGGEGGPEPVLRGEGSGMQGCRADS